MKVQIKRDGEIIEVDNVTIILDDETKFKISQSSTSKGIEVNKIDFDNGDISVKPCYANQIEVR